MASSQLLDIDINLSKSLSLYNGHIGNNLFATLRFILKVFEWSGHGVLWLLNIGFMLYSNKNSISTSFFYKIILIGLILDLIVIAFSKLTFKRQRPSYNEGDLPLSASKIDGYSFPSGHATRAFMIYVLFSEYSNDGFYASPNFVLIWAIMLGYSRVALGRHFISDVIAGTLIGLVEGYLTLAVHRTVLEHCEYVVQYLISL